MNEDVHQRRNKIYQMNDMHFVTTKLGINGGDFFKF